MVGSRGTASVDSNNSTGGRSRGGVILPILSRVLFWGRMPSRDDDPSVSSKDDEVIVLAGGVTEGEGNNDPISVPSQQQQQQQKRSVPMASLRFRPLEKQEQKPSELTVRQEEKEEDDADGSKKKMEWNDQHQKQQQQLKQAMTPLSQSSRRGFDLHGQQRVSFRIDEPSLSDQNGTSDERDENLTHKTSFRDVIDRYNDFRCLCGRIVNNAYVQTFIILLISINAIMMGIATYEFVWGDPHLSDVFNKVDTSFLIIFTVELAFQFIHLGWRLLMNGWLDFDLAVILISWSFDTVQIVRAFRIFRALRLVTRIKVMKDLIVGTYQTEQGHTVTPRLEIECSVLITKLPLTMVRFFVSSRHSPSVYPRTPSSSCCLLGFFFFYIGGHIIAQLFLVSCLVWPPLD